MLKLRCHHLLCIQGYVGKGYDKNFTKNMDSIVKYLKKHPLNKIKIICGVDDICALCPNKISDNVCITNNKVLTLDHKLLKILNLDLNMEYSYKYLVHCIYKYLDRNKFKELCKLCQWFKFGYCEKRLFFKRK